jgi:methyl coenzyme M reductase subunit D
VVAQGRHGGLPLRGTGRFSAPAGAHRLCLFGPDRLRDFPLFPPFAQRPIQVSKRPVDLRLVSGGDGIDLSILGNALQRDMRHGLVKVEPLTREVLPFEYSSSSGRTRTCNPPVTKTLEFLPGSDYLITRPLAVKGRVLGAQEALLVRFLSL